jgi:tyrosine-protein phosphatase SIW14
MEAPLLTALRPGCSRRTARATAAGVFAALWLAGAVAAGAGAAQESPCGNFGRVGAGLFRGAEPDRRCLGHLAALGVRTVVNLRDEKDASEDEREEVLALGMRYANMPMSGFDRPSATDVQRVLAFIEVSGNQPVFLHCKRGRDRTGVVVAAYRVTNDRWAAEKALVEAEDFGLAWWQIRMRRFIRELDAHGDRP